MTRKALEGHTLLIVDDDPWTARVLAMIARAIGATVVTASTRAEAMTQVSAERIDAALVDLVLADGETGEDVARDLAALTPPIPCLAITGDLDAVRTDRTHGDLFQDAMVKPVGGTELAEKVLAALHQTAPVS